MAKCRECGKPAGLMFSMCEDCLTAANEKLKSQGVERRPPPMIDARMISTNDQLSGHTARESLGIARGVSVRSRSILGNMAAGFEATFGGQISTFEKLCDDTRQVAFDRMRVHAAALGADAVTGMRFDANEIAEGITEVLCYGTAILASPNGESIAENGAGD